MMEQINEILDEFEGLVVSRKLRKNILKENGDYQYKLTVVLKNTSLLAIEERMNHLGYQYSYQWMQADNTLIIRWDNAPKHLDIAADHKHVGSNSNVQPSEETTLRKVLNFIAKTLGVF